MALNDNSNERTINRDTSRKEKFWSMNQMKKQFASMRNKDPMSAFTSSKVLGLFGTLNKNITGLKDEVKKLNLANTKQPSIVKKEKIDEQMLRELKDIGKLEKRSYDQLRDVANTLKEKMFDFAKIVALGAGALWLLSTSNKYIAPVREAIFGFVGTIGGWIKSGVQKWWHQGGGKEWIEEDVPLFLNNLKDSFFEWWNKEGGPFAAKIGKSLLTGIYDYVSDTKNWKKTAIGAAIITGYLGLKNPFLAWQATKLATKFAGWTIGKGWQATKWTAGKAGQASKWGWQTGKGLVDGSRQATTTAAQRQSELVRLAKEAVGRSTTTAATTATNVPWWKAALSKVPGMGLKTAGLGASILLNPKAVGEGSAIWDPTKEDEKKMKGMTPTQRKAYEDKKYSEAVQKMSMSGFSIRELSPEEQRKQDELAKKFGIKHNETLDSSDKVVKALNNVAAKFTFPGAESSSWNYGEGGSGFTPDYDPTAGAFSKGGVMVTGSVKSHATRLKRSKAAGGKFQGKKTTAAQRAGWKKYESGQIWAMDLRGSAGDWVNNPYEGGVITDIGKSSITIQKSDSTTDTLVHINPNETLRLAWEAAEDNKLPIAVGQFLGTIQSKKQSGHDPHLHVQTASGKRKDAKAWEDSVTKTYSTAFAGGKSASYKQGVAGTPEGYTGEPGGFKQGAKDLFEGSMQKMVEARLWLRKTSSLEGLLKLKDKDGKSRFGSKEEALAYQKGEDLNLPSEYLPQEIKDEEPKHMILDSVSEKAAAQMSKDRPTIPTVGEQWNTGMNSGSFSPSRMAD